MTSIATIVYLSDFNKLMYPNLQPGSEITICILEVRANAQPACITT